MTAGMRSITASDWLISEDPQEMLVWLRAAVLNYSINRPEIPGIDWSICSNKKWLDRKLRSFVEVVTGITTWVNIGDDFDWSNFALTVVLSEHATHHPPLPIQANILREIVANPFRPIAFDRSWCAPSVLALALEARNMTINIKSQTDNSENDMACQTPLNIYGAGCNYIQSDRLAILADALEDAGCPDKYRFSRSDGDSLLYSEVPHPLLVHLRNQDQHLASCWALDLVIGEDCDNDRI